MLEWVGRALGFAIMSPDMARAIVVSVAVTACHPLIQRARKGVRDSGKCPQDLTVSSEAFTSCGVSVLPSSRRCYHPKYL